MPERPAADGESSVPHSLLRSVYQAGLSATALDLTALTLTAALLLAVAFQMEGLPRQLLALAFVSFVPGWAVVGRLQLGGGIRPLVLAAPASFMLSAGGATIMLLLHAWRPVLLLGALALASTALVSWTLIAPLRAELAAAGSPAGRLLPGVLGKLPRLNLVPGSRAGLPARWGLAAVSTTIRALKGALPPALTGARHAFGGRQKIWLAAIVIQLFWLVPAMSLVLVFALHPLTGAISLAMGVLAGVVLGVHRRTVLLVAAGLAVLMGGLLVIGWQSLPGGDLYSAAIAAFEVSLDVWGPVALGGALGFATVPIVGHLEEQYGKRLGAQVPSGVSIRVPEDRIEGGGELAGSGRALHGDGAAKQKARRTTGADTKEVEPVNRRRPAATTAGRASEMPSAEGRTAAVLAQQTDSPDQKT
jgi:hypothetical protein